MDAVFAQIKARRAVIEVEVDDESTGMLSRGNSFSSIASAGNSTSSKLRRLSSIRKLSAARRNSKAKLEGLLDLGDIATNVEEDEEEEEKKHDDQTSEQRRIGTKRHSKVSWQPRKASFRSFKNLPPPPPPLDDEESGESIPPPPPTLFDSLKPPNSLLSGSDSEQDSGQEQVDFDIPLPPMPPPTIVSTPQSNTKLEPAGRLKPHQEIPLPPPLPNDSKIDEEAIDVAADLEIPPPPTPKEAETKLKSVFQEQEKQRILMNGRMSIHEESRQEQVPTLDLRESTILERRKQEASSSTTVADAKPPLESSSRGTHGVDQREFDKLYKELQELKSNMGGLFAKDNELRAANQEATKTREKMYTLEKQNASLSMKVKDLEIALEKERTQRSKAEKDLEGEQSAASNAKKELEELKGTIPRLKEELCDERAKSEQLAKTQQEEISRLQAQVEQLQGDLLQVKRDNKRIVQHIMQAVGGRENLEKLLSQKPGSEGHADQLDQIFIDSSTIPACTISTSAAVEKTPLAGGLVHPPSTYHTRNELHQVGDQMEVGAKTMKHHDEYAAQVESRVDRLREALHQARRKERAVTSALRQSRNTNAYLYLYK